MRAIETLAELVDPDGTIAIMSSGQGSIANNERGGFEIYRASKSALNQLMRSYAARHRNDARTLLLMAPGWVKTDLGGPDAVSPSTRASPTSLRPLTRNAAAPASDFSTISGRPSPGENLAWTAVSRGLCEIGSTARFASTTWLPSSTPTTSPTI